MSIPPSSRICALLVLLAAVELRGNPGDIYVADGGRISRIDGVTGMITMRINTTTACTGFSPLAFGPDGLLYSGCAAGIVRLNPDTGALVDLFIPGDFPLGSSMRFGPDGHIYTNDTQHDQILRYNGLTGQSMGVFASGGGLGRPEGFAFGPDGHLYVAGYLSRNVIRYDGATGQFMDVFVPDGSGGMTAPSQVVFDEHGDLCVLAVYGAWRGIGRYDGWTGAFRGMAVQTPDHLTDPEGVLVLDGAGNFVASDKMRRFDAVTGTFLGSFFFGGTLNPTIHDICVQPPACRSSAECNDGNASTRDTCFGFACSHQTVRTLFVKADAAGANTGTNWANAYRDLQDALDYAAARPKPIEIWVAAGTYKPDRSTRDRTHSFQLRDGVFLYGGFAGTESSLAQRDFRQNVSRLSGDLHGDDDGFNGLSDNSRHVVRASGAGVDAPAVLDGFEIRSGYANGPGVDATGAGMLCVRGAPTVSNCTFLANVAGSGAAIAYADSSHASLLNCRFLGNTASVTGGAIRSVEGTVAVLVNCTFSGNAASRGGALSSMESVATLVNATIVGNSASIEVGGLYNYDSSYATLANCILWDNTDASGSGQDAQLRYGSWPGLDYCRVMGWNGSLPGGATSSGAPAPQFVNGWGPDWTYGTIDDDLRLVFGSTGVDAGSTAAYQAGVQRLGTALPTLDPAGNARIQDHLAVADQGAGPAPVVDLGAFEQGDCNGNMIEDGLDIAGGQALDCDDNRIPDACDPDCNMNGAPDACDLATHASVDCNDNHTPDECEAGDSDDNGVLDECERGACCVDTACSETIPALCVTFVCNTANYYSPEYASCWGDLDGNNVVNPGDRGFVSANIGRSDAPGVCLYDLDGNGVINAGDRGFVAANMGICEPLPGYMNGSGLNPSGDGPDTRFPPAVWQGVGTRCTVTDCP